MYGFYKIYVLRSTPFIKQYENSCSVDKLGYFSLLIKLPSWVFIKKNKNASICLEKVLHRSQGDISIWIMYPSGWRKVSNLDNMTHILCAARTYVSKTTWHD